MAHDKKYSLKGEMLLGCNCDWDCSCNFEIPPFYGNCEGVYMWHVVSGHYDDVSLDGTTFGQFGLYPEAIHMGNGTVFDVVDEKLNPEQRQAVETLLTEVEPFSVFHAWQPLSWGFSTSPWNCTWTGFAAASRSLESWT